MHVVLMTVLSVVLSYALLLAIKSLRNRGKRGKLPQAPPTLPVLGNLLQLPTDEEWVTYQFAVETASVAIELIVQATAPKRSVSGPTVRALSLAAWGRRIRSPLPEDGRVDACGRRS